MKRFTFLFLTICLAIVASHCSSQSKMMRASSASGQELLQAINAVRAKGCNCGNTYMSPVKALQWNAKLEVAAQNHSNYMHRRKLLTHSGPHNTTPADRVKAAGYPWSYVAENIALGQPSVKEVMNSWLQSVEHCKNIMSNKATEMGAALKGEFWTAVFAAPM